MSGWPGISVSRSRVQAQNLQRVHLPKPVREYGIVDGIIGLKQRAHDLALAGASDDDSAA